MTARRENVRERLKAIVPPLLLWKGLVSVGVKGAWATRAAGLKALWIAACAAAALPGAARSWGPSAQV